MFKKRDFLRFSGRNIVQGKIVGKGQKTRPERRATVKRASIGGIQGVLRDVSGPHRSLERSILRQNLKLGRGYTGEAKEKIIDQKVWKAFFKAGLPVPRFSKLDLRVESETFLATFMEDMRERFGKLYDGHRGGRPDIDLFRRVNKDRKLVRTLANDLATIFNLGYTFPFLDFWHFYEMGNGKLGRVILDFNAFEKIDLDAKAHTKRVDQAQAKEIHKNLANLRQVLGAEFDVFAEQLLEKLGNRIVRAEVEYFLHN
jgi:hypothetical protein